MHEAQARGVVAPQQVPHLVEQGEDPSRWVIGGVDRDKRGEVVPRGEAPDSLLAEAELEDDDAVWWSRYRSSLPPGVGARVLGDAPPLVIPAHAGIQSPARPPSSSRPPPSGSAWVRAGASVVFRGPRMAASAARGPQPSGLRQRGGWGGRVAGAPLGRSWASALHLQ